MQRLMQIFGELKRRNVFRAGAAYLVLAWLLIQVADIFLDAFAAPDWMMQAVIVALTLGFPVALVLSWIYEITVEGLKRTEDVRPEDSITFHTGRKLDFIVIGFLSVAVAMFAIDRFVWNQSADDLDTTNRDYSIAVLPTQLKSNEIAPLFGQISNDVVRLLQRSEQLRIAPHDAVTALPETAGLADIADQLNVRYIVSSTFQANGDDLQLTFSLFDSDSESEIWSDEFGTADLNQTMGQVSESILMQVNAEPLLFPSSTTDADTYQLYLSARQHLAADPRSEVAEKLFREAIQLDKRFVPALAGLCSLLVDQYRLLDAPGDFEEAERLCHRAWTIDSRALEVHLALGNLYIASGQRERARESYAAALTVNPSNLMAQAALAGILGESSPDAAERQLKGVVQQHPGSPYAHRRMAMFYYGQGRYEDAVEHFEWIVRLRPGDESAMLNLSSGLVLSGMFGEAKTLLTEMIETSPPKRGAVYSNLASVLFYEKDFAGAAEIYRSAIEKEPGDHKLYRNLGDTIWHLHGREEAKPIFDNAIQLAERHEAINPDDVYVIGPLAVAYASIGDLDGFQRVKDRLLDAAPLNPQVHYEIAVAASRLADMQTAKFHAEKAHELGFPVALLRADPDIAASGASIN